MLPLATGFVLALVVVQGARGSSLEPAGRPSREDQKRAAERRKVDQAALEVDGAQIGSITINVVNIFDTSIPAEDKLAFRTVNRLHIKTREQTVRNQLLFKEGEPLVASRLAETERNLRALPYIQEASVEVSSVENGRANILVTTRDNWTTGVGIRFNVSGGKSTSGLSLSEGNLLGRGKQLEFDVQNGLDRTTEDLAYEDRNILGSRLHLLASHRSASDGSGNALLFELPFFSLESRRSFGLETRRGTSRFSFYQEGEEFQRFDHTLSQSRAWYGWSPGLRDGATRRLLLGYGYQKDEFDESTDLATNYPNEHVPATRTVSGPSIEYSWTRANYIKVKYFERFSRFEDFNVGGTADVRLQISRRGFGATSNEVICSLSASRGFRTSFNGWLLTNVSFDGRTGGRNEGILHGDATHYYRGWPRQTFVTRISGDAGIHLDASQHFLLGGDSGIRGFGARRFDGDKLFLINIEDRVHANRQFLRLLQFGLAGFADVGNSWGGIRSTRVCRRVSGVTTCRIETEDNNFGNLKGDIGIALLADVVRAAQTNFVRLNIAYPVDGRKYDEAVILLSIGKEGGF